jgi:glutaconate CoA-transferase subunit A
LSVTSVASAPPVGTGKLTSMREAVARLVRDGDTIYPAGFTHLMPFAAVHEIIRQGRRNLTLCRATPDLLFEQLALTGAVEKLVFSFAGNPGLGTLHTFRRLVEAQQLQLEEYSHFGLVARLFAGAARLPFMPLRSHVGSDLPSVNPDLREVKSPYDDTSVPVVPALNPDVAIVHVQRADASGNAQAWGILGEQRDAAFAAKRVIVTAEEIVPESVVRADPNRTLIPSFVVHAVVHAPWGAHPSFAQGYYDRDNDFFVQWHELSRDATAAKDWLQTWVYDLPDLAAYRSMLGAARMKRLVPGPAPSGSVDYGAYV